MIELNDISELPAWEIAGDAPVDPTDDGNDGKELRYG